MYRPKVYKGDSHLLHDRLGSRLAQGCPEPDHTRGTLGHLGPVLVAVLVPEEIADGDGQRSTDKRVPVNRQFCPIRYNGSR